MSSSYTEVLECPDLASIDFCGQSTEESIQTRCVYVYSFLPNLQNLICFLQYLRVFRQWVVASQIDLGGLKNAHVPHLDLLQQRSQHG